MITKLIDWTTVPKGAAVVDNKQNNFAAMVGLIATNVAILSFTFFDVEQKATLTKTDLCNTKQTRLAPAEQQPWLVYEEGVTVIPEWAECGYKFAASTLISADESGAYIYLADAVPLGDAGIAIAYKLGNSAGKIFKDGWTDNPEEAGTA